MVGLKLSTLKILFSHLCFFNRVGPEYYLNLSFHLLVVFSGLNQRESGCWNVNLLQAGYIDVGVYAAVDIVVEVDVDVNVYSDVNAFFNVDIDVEVVWLKPTNDLWAFGNAGKTQCIAMIVRNALKLSKSNVYRCTKKSLT